MVPLLQRLIDLLNEFKVAPHTAATALRDLLRALATEAVQDDPAQATLPPGDWPLQVVDAIEEGATRAASLNAERVRLHVHVEELPLATPTGQVTDDPALSIGLFVDRRKIVARY